MCSSRTSGVGSTSWAYRSRLSYSRRLAGRRPRTGPTGRLTRAERHGRQTRCARSRGPVRERFILRTWLEGAPRLRGGSQSPRADVRGSRPSRPREGNVQGARFLPSRRSVAGGKSCFRLAARTEELRSDRLHLSAGRVRPQRPCHAFPSVAGLMEPDVKMRYSVLRDLTGSITPCLPACTGCS